MISANAYLGADVVCEALNTGAPIVVSGRVADPSLFLAPMMHEFGSAYDDLPKLAQGTAAGHLPECTASVTGGCFGWPGKKDVPDLARNGFPFADVKADGSIVSTPSRAAEIVKQRLKLQGFAYDNFPFDLIGMSTLHDQVAIRPEPYEVRLRMAGRTNDRKAAHAIGFEVRALHMHGPGGAGGACEPRVRDVLAVKSVLLPQSMVKPQVIAEVTP